MKGKCCPPKRCVTLVDPMATPISDDQSFTINPGTFTSSWQRYEFPIDVTIIPTSYPGTSQNGYAGLTIALGRNPAAAGADPVFITVAAGLAFTLPCGVYWIRTDQLFGGGSVNFRMQPALAVTDESLHRGVYPGPTFATVGVTSANALAARVGRRRLILTNTSGSNISIAFGGSLGAGFVAAVLNSGITLISGAQIALYGRDCPEDAMQAIAASAGSNLGIQEG